MHANAPLTAEGRRRLVARVLDEGRPQAHVAAEAGIARATVRKWVARFLAGGRRRWSTGPAARITARPGPRARWWTGSRRCAASGSSRLG